MLDMVNKVWSFDSREIMVTPQNPFWTFTLKTYDMVDVEQLSLDLQEKCGANVGVLFLCLWLGRRGYGLSATEMNVVLESIVPWDESVVQGMRAVRHALKRDWPEHKLGTSLRRELKELELLAERHLFNELYDRFTHVPTREVDPDNAALLTAANLRRYPVLDVCWDEQSIAIQAWLNAVLPAVDRAAVEETLSRVV
ncbi:MAG: TIGR02444 family protein [Cellvibrionaceae bacterium]